MAAKKQTEQVVELIPIRIQEFEVGIRGISPLIVHRFSEKAKKQIEDKQQKKTKEAKAARDPHEEFISSLYVMPGSVAGVEGAEYGIPAIWFKQAAIYACTYVDSITKVSVRGAFHILADDGGLVRLDYARLRMREDYVTIGMGTRDIRYRGEFSDWSTRLRIRYNAAALTPEQIVNLLNIGGFSSGLGEMRPSQQCSDQYGMYEVELS